MSGLTKYFLGAQGLVWGVLLALVVYLVARRVRKRRDENFEKRDN